MSTDQAFVGNGHGTELVINSKNKLLLQTREGERVFLGPATKDRVDQLIFNLTQIRTVCD